MTNNDILKKLRVALQLRNDDIIHILKLVDYDISPGELSALFRSEDSDKYKNCGDQILRNFLNGLVIYLRGPKDKPNEEIPRVILAKKAFENKSRPPFEKKKDFSGRKPAAKKSEFPTVFRKRKSQ